MSYSNFALATPFIGSNHPQAENLRVYGRDWVQRVGLVQKAADLEAFDAARYWQLIAGAYPTVTWEVLTLAHDWNSWGFYLDDYDDSGSAAHQPEVLHHLFTLILALLEDQPLPNDPPRFLLALADIWRRIHQYSDSQWRRRFTGTLAESFEAYRWEAYNRANQRIPSVSEYLGYRQQTGGWMTDLLLVDLSQGRTLPEQLFRWPDLQQLLDTANNIICWSNDLYSYAKEQAVGDVHNLISVVMSAFHCNEEAAVRQVMAWHDAAVREWELRKYQVLQVLMCDQADRQHILAYIGFCEAFIASNHTWSRRSGRYQAPNTLSA